MLKEFKEFIMRGNVIFSTIVKSLVDDVIMPPIGLLLGNIDFSNLFAVLKAGKVAGPYETLAAAKAAGAVSINYGYFINTVISFLIVAFAVFILIKNVNKLQKEKPAEVTTKECPYCISAIPLKAQRCPNCTSELKA
jgi:large conductance mechanosensitive channel